MNGFLKLTIASARRIYESNPAFYRAAIRYPITTAGVKAGNWIMLIMREKPYVQFKSVW
jgi:hypothetical protein